MKTHQLLIWLTFLVLLASCQNYQSIVVVGKVTDEVTGKAVSKAEVVVLCWYSYGIDEATFIKQTLMTDDNGKYIATFEKGYQVDVASKAQGFIATRRYHELEDNKTEVDLKLPREKINPSLIAYLSTDHFELDVTEKTPFLRVRIYSLNKSDSLDLGKLETFGFDLSNQKTTTDTIKSDIWFKLVNKAEQPKTIVAHENGGVIPVYSNEISSSFFYEKTIAPIRGYLREYTFKGNEEGFFVLCRDGKTYGKIILEKSLNDTSSPDGKGGFYKEFGRPFSCLYQPSGTSDLSYSNPDIDLESYLVDSRLR